MGSERDLLAVRFLNSIRDVAIFLKMTGVDLVHQKGTNTTMMKYWIWSGFWLLLNTQSGIFIIIRRRVLELLIALLSSSAQLLSEGRLTDHLNEVTFRIAAFIFETLTHYVLVWRIRPTLRSLIEVLEPVDLKLGRPNLSPVWQNSIAGLIFTSCITILNMAFAMYWELVHPNRMEDWFYITEAVLLKFTTMFTLMALFLFVLCGQLLIVYHKKIVNELGLLLYSKRVQLEHHSEDIWFLLSQFRIVCVAKRQLFHDFRSMLMMNCFLSVVNIITCSYYVINNFFTTNNWAVVTWDICDTLEFIFRLWLICHTTDEIRSTAENCVPILRKLRDQTKSKFERNKLTWFIIEIRQWSSHHNEIKDVEGLNLYGLLSINKRLMLQIGQAIVMFSATIFQFTQEYYLDLY